MNQLKRFENKVALVAGGSSGIGRETAIRLAREGARVVVAARRADEGQKVVDEICAAGGTAIFVQTDIASEADVKALVETAQQKFGPLDVAFNNAGIEGALGPITQLSGDDFDKTVGVNFKGAWLLQKYEIGAMMERGGSIVNVATIAAMIGMPGTSLYGASKAGVVGLTRALAMEWAGKNIRVNVVSPGAIETPMLDRFFGGNAEAIAGMAAQHPLGRLGQTPDIAEAVLYLLSDQAAWVTGQNLAVDGGYTTQ